MRLTMSRKKKLKKELKQEQKKMWKRLGTVPKLTLSGFSIEIDDEIVSTLAAAMQEEIDKDILAIIKGEYPNETK